MRNNAQRVAELSEQLLNATEDLVTLVVKQAQQKTEQLNLIDHAPHDTYIRLQQPAKLMT